MVRSLAISIIGFSSTKPFRCERGILYGMPNQSYAEQFDRLYGRLWRALFKGDVEDLSQHERQLLHHVSDEKGIPLGIVANHLGIPKSSASERVKSLERRGFLTRRRDPDDERRLSIVLTDMGVARLRRDSVLDLVRLGGGLEKNSDAGKKELLAAFGRVGGGGAGGG